MLVKNIQEKVYYKIIKKYRMKKGSLYLIIFFFKFCECLERGNLFE